MLKKHHLGGLSHLPRQRNPLLRLRPSLPKYPQMFRTLGVEMYKQIKTSLLSFQASARFQVLPYHSSQSCSTFPSPTDISSPTTCPTQTSLFLFSSTPLQHKWPPLLKLHPPNPSAPFLLHSSAWHSAPTPPTCFFFVYYLAPFEQHLPEGRDFSLSSLL